MQYPEQSPKILFKMVQQYKEAQLLLAGIQLDVFSYLGKFTPACNVALLTGYNGRNLALFLNSLAAIGLLEKQQQEFRNTKLTELFLSRNSAYYMGEYLVFWNKMTNLDTVESAVRYGPERANNTMSPAGAYDFQKLARLSATEIRTGRVQSFLQGVSQLFQPNEPIRFLDLGAGSGVMSMELANHFPAASGTLFEQPSVADVPEQLISEHQLQHRLVIIRGDFTTDPLGENYDLIIASGILDFARTDLNAMTAKLAAALAPDGYLYLVTHKVSDDYLSPKESIIGWLSSHLAGLDILLTKTGIEAALAAAGFTKMAKSTLDGAMESLTDEFYTVAK